MTVGFPLHAPVADFATARKFASRSISGDHPNAFSSLPPLFVRTKQTGADRPMNDKRQRTRAEAQAAVAKIHELGRNALNAAVVGEDPAVAALAYGTLCQAAAVLEAFANECSRS